MGAPELPGDPGEENLRPAHNINQAPVSSDENSDNEVNHQNYGYQPLAMGVDDVVIFNNDLNDDAEDEDNDIAMADEATQVTHGDPNLPHVESAEVEIEREVWNQPRPQELQIELDNTRTEQILSAMANFTLPNAAVPDWATGVPEERWKEELLQRIRQRKEPQTNAATNEIKAEQHK